MSGYRFRRAAAADRGAIIEFMNLHWGSRHPLVNLPDYFTYYYQNGDPDSELLNFALCLEDERIAALCGFIPSSRDGREIWVSIWCADKKAQLHAGGRPSRAKNMRRRFCRPVRVRRRSRSVLKSSGRPSVSGRRGDAAFFHKKSAARLSRGG